MTRTLFTRRLTVGLFALAPLLSPMLSPTPALAASAPALRLTVTPISHLRIHSDTVVTSTNWAGYAATGSTYTSVTTTFTQPAIKCSTGDTYSAFWAGLDGYSSDTVEQAGTEADCDGATADYYAWYELYPADPVTYSNAVKPGDVITETVAFSGTDTYTFTTKDATEGWTKTTKKTSSGDARSSAEIIVEAPYSGGVLPLANFGSVTFTGCRVDGDTLGSFNPTTITSPGLTVSPIIDGTQFTVTESKTTSLG